MVSTSANLSGTQPAIHAFQVRRYFGAALDYVVPGKLGGASGPSAIRDVRTGEVLRNG